LYSRWETAVHDLQSALMDSISSSDMLYMETKSIFVQLIRSIPHAAEKQPYNLAALAERAATTKDATLVRKGIKVKEMLRELEEQKIIEHTDGYKLMQEEVAAELVHLGNLREKVLLETKSLESVYKTILDHNNYMRSQLEQYKAYLQNVRLTASKDKGASTGVGVVTVGGKEKKPAKAVVLGPYRFTHAQLEKEGIIVESNVPDSRCVVWYTMLTPKLILLLYLLYRRPNIYFNITSPTPGTFIIALHYKGREKAILEMDLKIDDLLEKVSFRRCCTSRSLAHFSFSKKTTNICWTWNTFNSTCPKFWVFSKRSSPSGNRFRIFNHLCLRYIFVFPVSGPGSLFFSYAYLGSS
jgi:Ras GTPase-activating-like protein IQGAP2/3